jgi:MFS family permease
MDGVGAFIGALTMAAFARPDRYAWLYLGGVTGYMAMIVCFALSPTPLLAGASLLLMGFCQAGFSIMQATLVYLLTPQELRSRVLGILSVCIGLGPIGFTALGLAADWLGAPAAALATGCAGLAVLLLTSGTWRAILRAKGETTP